MSLPVLNGYSAEFYGFCRQHELRFQRCTNCHAWRHPPRPMCNQCHSFDAEWVAVSGAGTLYAWTVAVAPMGAAFAAKVPYIAAIVALEEGPRLASTLVDVAETDLRVGMPLRVCFDDLTPEVSLPKFRPA